MIDVIAPEEQEGSRLVVRSWLKRPGDAVALADPLVELESDKVTQELAAPAAGVLSEIVMLSDAVVTPGAVLARINTAPAIENAGTPRLSPVVRRLAEQYGIDPATVRGSGRDGRVTREDMEAAHAARATTAAPGPQRSRRVPHSSMRLAIARNMTEAVARAPHVTAVIEVDFTAVQRHREQRARGGQGLRVSYTAYVVMAAVAATRSVPEVNSRWHDEALEIFEDIDIGVGTALGDAGLIVPVIRAVQRLTLDEVAARLGDLTERARAGKLTRADVVGGGFTISNHGVSGTLLATPVILHEGQSAILGVGRLEKRAVVREIDGTDALVIRPMAYVSLTIDHRALDGHQTNRWLAAFAERIESWEPPCTRS